MSTKTSTGRIIPREGVDTTPLDIPLPNCRFTEYNYIEISYDNNTGRPQPARYNSNQKAALVDVPSNYKLSAVRVEVDLDVIPMFTTDTRNLVVFMHYEEGIEVYDSTSALFPLTTTVYSVYDVLQALNASLLIAFQDIITAYEVVHGPGSWTGDVSKAQNQPFAVYNNPLFTVYNDYRNSQDITNTPIILSFSPDLAVLFSGIYMDVNGQVSPTSPIEVLFPQGPANINYVDLQPPQVPDTYVVNKQAYDSTEAWYDVDRIVLITDSIPIRQQTIASAPQSGSNIQYSIITDFGLLINNTASNPATKFRYLPTAQYRWIDLIGDAPLNRISLSLAYANNEGTIRPVNVRPGGSFNTLLLFAKTITG